MIPADFDAPAKFLSFRKDQVAALERLAGSGKRIDVENLPVGVGKSLVAWSLAKQSALRTVILTGTKGLMDQYINDFRQSGMVEVRGMSNYPCKILDNGRGGYVPGCDQGPCLDGEQCVFRDKGCYYYDAWRLGKEQDIVLTNYDAWFAHGIEAPYNLGERDLVIADEAHSLAEAVVKAVGVEFTGKDVKREQGMEVWGLDEWRSWAWRRREEAIELLSNPSLRNSEKRRVRALLARFNRLAASGEDWALDWVEFRGSWKVQLEPISPAPYVEGWLLRNAAKVVLLSGTIRPSHMIELGFSSDDYNFFETASPFDPKRRPIYRVKLGFRVNSKTSEMNLGAWVSKQDQIISRGREQLSGLIHTASYARARFLKQHSKHGERMLIHDSQDTRETVALFKSSAPGTILVSPVMHTGWDFPYDLARWQIIAKVPYPDTRSGLAAARKAADDSWDKRHAIAQIQQSAGRVMRAEDDAGETFIVDDGMDFLWRRYREHFNLWFKSAYKEVDSVPGVVG